MTYHRQTRIEFNHCDPAGIVFYPRYFEMTNSICENFFREIAGHPFERMVAEGNAVPIVRVESEFRAPSRLGDLIDWALDVERLGASSVTFRLVARCQDQPRLTARVTQVWIGADHRPARWPDALRAALADHLEDA
jgi:4-hydroxybenzoyl-CoA thioesterase